MNYNYAALTNQIYPHAPVGKRNAYHQAGHAAAICLGNQEKQLPAVHFQVSIKPHERDIRASHTTMRLYGKCVARVEGGRLVQSLPLSFAEAARGLSGAEQERYRCAFEADVINLLAGSLSEAKYVALRDGEAFNANLVYLGALQYYGGKEDLEAINDYMDCLTPDAAERKQKLAELFLAAYSFINQRPNWKAIAALAGYILDVNQVEANCVIPCEDLMALLDPNFTTAAGLYTPLMPGYLETLILR
jgi:hypothetical protein